MTGVIAGFPPDADGLSWLKSHLANLLVAPTIPHSTDRKHPRGRIPRVERPETLGQTNLTARPRPRSSCFRRARLDETNLRSLGRLRRFRMGGTEAIVVALRGRWRSSVLAGPSTHGPGTLDLEEQCILHSPVPRCPKGSADSSSRNEEPHSSG